MTVSWSVSAHNPSTFSSLCTDILLRVMVVQTYLVAMITRHSFQPPTNVHCKVHYKVELVGVDGSQLTETGTIANFPALESCTGYTVKVTAVNNGNGKSSDSRLKFTTLTVG